MDGWDCGLNLVGRWCGWLQHVVVVTGFLRTRLQFCSYSSCKAAPTSVFHPTVHPDGWNFEFVIVDLWSAFVCPWFMMMHVVAFVAVRWQIQIWSSEAWHQVSECCSPDLVRMTFSGV
jgi:hypothetical protein